MAFGGIDAAFQAAIFDSFQVHHHAVSRMVGGFGGGDFGRPSMVPAHHEFGRLSQSASRARLGSANGGGGGNGPSYGRRASSHTNATPAGLRTPTDSPAPAYSNGARQQTRGTLARDGILPKRVSREVPDALTAPSVAAHTLPSVAAPRVIQGHSRESSSSTQSSRSRRATADPTSTPPVKPPLGSTIGGGWIRTGEGLGRARWDQSHAEIKLEGTSNSLFLSIHDEGRNQGIASMPEWTLSCELKCTGAAYLCCYTSYERFTSGSEPASGLVSSASSSSNPNSSTLSFLSVCCNTASKTWSLELRKRGQNASIVLGTVRDETLSSNRFYHINLSLSRGRFLTLQVDGHTFFDRIPLSCLSDSNDGSNHHPSTTKLEGKSFGVGVVRSKVHLRAFHLREKGALNHEPTSAPIRARSASSTKSLEPYTASTVAYANGQPVGGAHPGVSDRTAAVFGSVSAASANVEVVRPSSSSYRTDRYTDVERSSVPVLRGGGPTSQPSHEDTPVPRQAYSSSLHGDDPKMIEMIENHILTRDTGITMDDIASLQEAKHLLKEAVILPLILPDFFQGIRQPSKGLLLHGPPGTGKTLLAKAIANVSEVTFFDVNSSVLTSKWRGDSEKLVTCLFNMARYYAPAIIFLDEIDALLSARGSSSEHEASRAFKAVMFSQIDGLLSAPTSSSSESRLVMLLATSNCPWDLDQAIRRRLEKRIYIPLPDHEARVEMLRIHLRDISLSPDVNLETLASRTDGYSGADLKIVARDAAMAPFRKLISGKTPSQIRELKDTGALAFTISQQDFLDAIQRVQPSVAKGESKRYEEWQRDFGSGM